MTSYVMVPANIVKQACLNYIKSLVKYAEEEIEKMIQQEMSSNWRWWKSSKTREAAIKRQHNRDWNFHWDHMHSIKDYAQENVQHLLAMAELGDPIALSGNDAIIVNKYKE